MHSLQGITVLDFSQYLAGPAAAMRLADLGARVIKIERTGVGDLSRQLTLSNLTIDGDSTVFHAINRNKESFEANLKEPHEQSIVKNLVRHADVIIHNFRPGTMERLGFDYGTLRSINPRLIYASVTGYGDVGPWANKAGQDLLVQSLSGLTWLNGSANGKPVPFGLSVVDMFASAQIVQGILALLIDRSKKGIGGRIDVSLLEAALDMQFEVLTTYYNDGGKLPDRGSFNNAHAYLGAPYGIYQTLDGYIALAMGPVDRLGKLIGCPECASYSDQESWFLKRDEIKQLIATQIVTRATNEWLNILESAGFWCAPVLNMKEFVEHPSFQAIDMVQKISRPNGASLYTTRCPIRMDGGVQKSAKWAPSLGEDTQRIKKELKLEQTHPNSSETKQFTQSQADENELPLENLLVLDFSQFLSGPSASLRLADMGARVVKIEKPEGGDICRSLYVSNLDIDGDSSLFHAINRNKDSITVDLKDREQVNFIKRLIEKADVVIQNFRPGVIERLGLDYQTVSKINPRIIYGSISGYGSQGPLRNHPGQDLLVQSISGLPWINGDAGGPPTAFGLSIVDMMAGAHLTQGILAGLVRREVTNVGGLIEVSLLESVADLQFEILTAYLNDGGIIPRRSAVNNGNAYLAAPYGIYQTQDGYMALAMGAVTEIGSLIGCELLTTYTDRRTWFDNRDEIKRVLEDHLLTQTTRHWLDILESHDIWCADVLTWDQLIEHKAFQVLSMEQVITRNNGTEVKTTRCPIRINGKVLVSAKGAPKLGEHNTDVVKSILKEINHPSGISL